MFFSVVIPTRNRPEMAHMAIRSVLRQDFSDLEVVVSDNSSTQEQSDELTAAVRKLGDERVRYIRPQTELSMGQHWEFALGHARGEYVGYLTDRMAFKRDALSQVRSVIAEQRCDVVAYSSSGVLEDASPYRLQRPPFSGRTETYESAWVVDLLSRSIAPWGAPCMLNSFTSRQVISEMTKAYPDLMAGAAPDISFCTHVLDHVESFHFLDLPLMISYGHWASNGAGVGTGRVNEAARDFARRIQRQGGLPYAPIPDLVLNQNVRANEYCRMRTCQKSGRFVELDLAAYCQEMAAELVLQGPYAQEADWRRLKRFMDDRDLAQIKPIPWRPPLSVVAHPVLQVASDWFGVNPRNRPVGKFASIEDALTYDEAHPPRPNSRESGFLRSRDRVRSVETGLRPVP